MKYRRRHTLNGVVHQAGEPYTGSVDIGRFLYQRGALEPDGGPDDDAITRAPGARARQQWGYEDTEPPPPHAPRAPTINDIALTPSPSKE